MVGASGAIKLSPKNMSTKTKPKPRVMWANYYSPVSRFPIIHNTRSLACAGSGRQVEPVRVAVIPLDDIEAIVERALAAYWPLAHTQSDGIRAALTSAGIPCKQRRARK